MCYVHSINASERTRPRVLRRPGRRGFRQPLQPGAGGADRAARAGREARRPHAGPARRSRGWWGRAWQPWLGRNELSAEDRQLLEPALLYVCYHRHVPQIDALIERQAQQGGPPLTVPFADEMIGDLVRSGFSEEAAGALSRALLPAAARVLLHPALARRRVRIDAALARVALEQRLHARHARLRRGAMEPHGGLLHAAAGRDRHRQGAGRRGHRPLRIHSLPSGRAALRGQFHRDLHRHQPVAIPGGPDRVGALRPSQGLVYRRDRSLPGSVRALQRARRAVPRRDRRGLDPGADQAAAGAAGAHLQPGRRPRQEALFRPRDRGDQPAARPAAQPKGASATISSIACART